jgi:hypothetical protein
MEKGTAAPGRAIAGEDGTNLGRANSQLDVNSGAAMA